MTLPPNHPDPPSDAPPGDADDLTLVEMCRAGSLAAFGLLYDRHRDVAYRHALSIVRHRQVAEDVTEESFARILAALHRGRGPTDSFRAYLATVVRHLAWQAGSERRSESSSLDAASDQAAALDADPLDLAPGTLVADAFRNLPRRWQLVIWHTEIDGREPAELAEPMGLSPNAVSALAYRARVGFRKAYFDAYRARVADPACRRAAPLLAHAVEAGARELPEEVLDHLESCPTCRDVARGAGETSRGLRALGPLVLVSPPVARRLGGVARSLLGRVLAPRASAGIASVAGTAAAVTVAMLVAGGPGRPPGTEPGRTMPAVSVAPSVRGDGSTIPGPSARGRAAVERPVAVPVAVTPGPAGPFSPPSAAAAPPVGPGPSTEVPPADTTGTDDPPGPTTTVPPDTAPPETTEPVPPDTAPPETTEPVPPDTVAPETTEPVPSETIETVPPETTTPATGTVGAVGLPTGAAPCPAGVRALFTS